MPPTRPELPIQSMRMRGAQTFSESKLVGDSGEIFSGRTKYTYVVSGQLLKSP